MFMKSRGRIIETVVAVCASELYDAEGVAFRACPSAERTLGKVQFRDVQTRTCNTSQVGYLGTFYAKSWLFSWPFSWLF